MQSPSRTAKISAWYPSTDGGASTTYSISWRINPAPESFAAQSVDVVIELSTDVTQSHDAVPDFKWPESLRSGLELGYTVWDIRTFVDQALQAHNKIRTPVALKLVIPTVTGYVAQSNIVQTRFHACPGIESVAGFLQPGERIEAFTAVQGEATASLQQLYQFLSQAIGAVHAINPDVVSPWKVLDDVEIEFRNRLGLQFLLPNPVPRKRIGLVQGLNYRPGIVQSKYYRMSLELLPHLNVDLVVFDEPGSCMENSNGPYSHLRESFYALDLTPDDGFVERLYLATKDKRLDGLTSRFDAVFDKVATVAQALHLPTASPSAMKIATNKYLTRVTCAQLGKEDSWQNSRDQVIHVKNRQELEHRLKDPAKPLQISYPVVVKPTRGWASYGVAKAVDEPELLANVEWAAGSITGFDDSQVMIEPYCDGPEIDINVAMWDGEVTFFDMSDNAPCAGDLDEVSGSGRKDFQEGLFMFPSQLPASEQTMVLNYIRECILLMGFRSGIFHCEARVQDSSMHFMRDSATGIIDLETKPESDLIGVKPEVFLIEINPRIPGYVGMYAAGWTYGVDLWALHVLQCVGDEARFRALSKTFENGPQHDSAVLLIMPEKSGVLRSGDPHPRLQVENPGLARAVPLCLNYFREGEYVTSPEGTGTSLETCFTSVMVVESKEGRKGLMRTVEEVRREYLPLIE
jgi:biotin carboxylase